ncbi:hypothetical protein ATJ97_3836 [Georgenia soli]|uniref:FHA domain-containing protein n=1 Tax=Georgenia soli TaxID=638953 RepID=A0A2A9EQY1_9MICO|nr:FHA domain-containing protein [Georgenia soli]PFG41288.1 hypothetical protein ATJ97_3836 [Georgenia soli]
MPFVPQAARTYLSTAQVADPLSPNDTIAPLRREALDVLGRAYGSRARLGAGALAWALGLVASALTAAAAGRWPTADGTSAWFAGAALLAGLCAAGLGVAVVHSGSVLSRAVAAWLATPSRSARTRDAARPHRAIATRAALGILAAVAVLGLAGLLVRELLDGTAAGAAHASLAPAAAFDAGPASTGDLRIVVGLAAAALVTATAAVSLLSGANRIHAAAWQPAPAPPRPRANGDGPAGTRHTVVMLLVPAPARNFLDPADYRRDWTTYGSMMIRRQVAMRTLLPAFTDLGRLGLGTLAWVASLVGATLLRAGAGGAVALGLTGSAAAVAGTVLVVLGVALGVVVVLAGSRLARGLALWALMPLLVHGDGSRRAAGSAAGTSVRRSDDPAGSLAPRLLAAVVVAAAGVVWAVDVVRDGLVVLAPYSTAGDLGVLLASVLGAAISWTTAAATFSGWRRVRAALAGRLGTSQEAAALREVHGAAPRGVDGAHRASSGVAGPGAASGAAPVAAPPGWAVAPVAAEPTPHRSKPTPHRSEVAQVRVGGRLLDPGTTLLGRAPAARPGERVDRALAVEDPTMSKTHLAVRVTPAGVWVTDRASTNGTTVVTDGGEQRLEAWRETKVPPGALVRAGATVLAVAGGESSQDVESTVLRDHR